MDTPSQSLPWEGSWKKVYQRQVNVPLHHCPVLTTTKEKTYLGHSSKH
jgi:hypothetical protein